MRSLKLRPILRSNAYVYFESKGNPWISERNRREDYPEEDLSRAAIGLAENPELDAWTKATKAREHHERRPEKALPFMGSRNPEALRKLNVERRISKLVRKPSRHAYRLPKVVTPGVRAGLNLVREIIDAFYQR